jgi:membrane protein implicated in regulation of membrane protease activity
MKLQTWIRMIFSILSVACFAVTGYIEHGLMFEVAAVVLAVFMLLSIVVWYRWRQSRDMTSTNTRPVDE